MAFINQQLCHTIQEATQYVNVLIEPYLASWGLWWRSRNQIGLLMCLLWFMPITQLLMHQQDSSHTNLCSGAKLQCLAMTGWAWCSTSLTVLRLKLFGWNSNLMLWCLPINKPWSIFRRLINVTKGQTSGKELVIPIGNHVLLRDHPEGWNKIQNKFKSDIYEVVDHHKEPNVYYIRRLSAGKDTQPKVVNRHQLFDLKRSVPPSVNRNSVDDLASVPLYLHIAIANQILDFHPMLILI